MATSYQVVEDSNAGVEGASNKEGLAFVVASERISNKTCQVTEMFGNVALGAAPLHVKIVQNYEMFAGKMAGCEMLADERANGDHGDAEKVSGLH